MHFCGLGEAEVHPAGKFEATLPPSTQAHSPIVASTVRLASTMLVTFTSAVCNRPTAPRHSPLVRSTRSRFAYNRAYRADSLGGSGATCRQEPALRESRRHQCLHRVPD